MPKWTCPNPQHQRPIRGWWPPPLMVQCLRLICEVLDSKCLRLCEAFSFCCNNTTLLQNSHRKHVNEHTWLNWALGHNLSTPVLDLDSILKSRDIILPTKVHLVKAMVFPVVMYRCKSWTIKKAEHQELMLLKSGVEKNS